MQAAQSSVGKVLSNIAMWPPIVPVRSTRYTRLPPSAISSAAWIPAIPPPMTSAAAFHFVSLGCAASVKGTP